MTAIHDKLGIDWRCYRAGFERSAREGRRNPVACGRFQQEALVILWCTTNIQTCQNHYSHIPSAVHRLCVCVSDRAHVCEQWHLCTMDRKLVRHVMGNVLVASIQFSFHSALHCVALLLSMLHSSVCHTDYWPCSNMARSLFICCNRGLRMPFNILTQTPRASKVQFTWRSLLAMSISHTMVFICSRVAALSCTESRTLGPTALCRLSGI